MNSSTFSNPPEPTPRWHWLLLAFVGFVRFVNLGFLDLQAWDEALYTVRAQGILKFGGWIDQSAFAIDGLYSALHPPLQVWLTAGMFNLMDVNEFSARVVPALAGAGTLFVVYALGKRFANSSTGLLAALLFGLNPFVTFFARQGQFDSLLVFFLTLSAYYFVRNVEDPSFRWSVPAGLALGAALMTKLFVALGLPLAIIAFLFLRKRPPAPAVLQHLGVSLAVAGIVSLPWHAYMTVMHAGGNPFFFFAESAMIERALFGTEGNVKPLETFYYVNQLLVLFPVGVCWFIAGIRDYWSSRDSTTGILFHWFLLFFVVFTLMRTKLAVYLLPMLVPASILAADMLWKEVQAAVPTAKRWFVLLSGTLLAVLWSASQAWRSALKQSGLALLSLQWPDQDVLQLTGILVIFAAGAVGISYVFTRLDAFPRYRVHSVFILLFILGGCVLYEVIVADQSRFRDGGNALGMFIKENAIHRVIVAGYERNPQITYYLDGADIGWRDDLSVRRIVPPADSLAYSTWLIDEMSSEPASALLIIEKDKFVRYKTVQPQRFVPSDFRLAFESRRYAGFGRSPSAYLAAELE